MRVPRRKHILLTGRPGIGKTTVVRRLIERLSAMVLAGFYTEEIRRGGQREGFRAVTLSGRSAILAHIRVKGPARIGRYGVDVAGFEELVIPELGRPCDLLVVDEIAKMECLSPRFVAAIERLLADETPVVATVAATGGGLVASVKSRDDVELLEVTHASRERLAREVAERLSGAP